MANGTMHCTILRAEEIQHHDHPQQHDLLPWADPYIASLFGDLARHEQAERQRVQLRRQCIERVFAAPPTTYNYDVAPSTDGWSVRAA